MKRSVLPGRTTVRPYMLFLTFVLGVLVGLAAYAAFESFGQPRPVGKVDDPRDIGLSWIWLAFGFGAQALFMGRMLVQWLASEKAGASIVPTLFWWLSLIGGLMLLTYFLRRGDPVGVVGQLFGIVVYSRNLILLYRRSRSEDSDLETSESPA